MEEVKHAIQDDYPNDFAHCFGCGDQNKDGTLISDRNGKVISR